MKSRAAFKTQATFRSTGIRSNDSKSWKWCYFLFVFVIMMLRPFNSQSSTELDRQQKESKPKKKHRKHGDRKRPPKKHEDDCYRCGDGGELVMCDRGHCPKVYHLKCLKLSKPPVGKSVLWWWQHRLSCPGGRCLLFQFEATICSGHVQNLPTSVHILGIWIVPGPVSFFFFLFFCLVC